MELKLVETIRLDKGKRPFADLRYGEENSIGPNKLICAATKD